MSEPWTAIPGLIGGVVGGVLQSNAQSRAANQIAGGNEVAGQALQKGVAQTSQLLQPYLQTGNLALPALLSHLGLDPASVTAAINQTTAAQSVDASPQRILQMFPDVMAEYQRLSPNNLKNNLGVTTPEQFATWWWNQYGQFDQGRVAQLQGPKAPAGMDYQAYWNANPDLAANAGLTGLNPGDLTGDGKVDDADRAAWHYANYGQAEGRTLNPLAPAQPTPAAAPAAQGSGAPTVTPGGQTSTNLYGAGYTTPVYTPPAAFQAPTYQAPDPFSYTLDRYQASPAYQWQLDQAQQATLANAAATGSLQSGAAAKALQDRSQQLAYQDYDNERNFAYNQYTADRAFGRSNYESDRGFDYNQYLNNLNFGRQTYQDDRNFGYGQFVDQRNYDANRYDQQTANLLGLTGIGQQATTGVANALLGYGNQASGLAQSTGKAQAGATVAQGDAMAGIAKILGEGGSTYLNALGSRQQ